jgi:integrase
MPIYKQPRSEHWYVRVKIGGKTVRRSAQTTDRKKALAFEARVREELYHVVKLGHQPSRTWDQAANRHLDEKEGRPSLIDDISYLKWLQPHLSGLALAHIDKSKLDEIIAVKKAEGVKPRTVNAVINLIRVILRKAKFEWDWLAGSDLPKFKALEEPKRRVRFLSHEEAQRLLAELPDHLRPVVIFSLETGLRLSNVTGLRWSEVDLARRSAWVYADEIKNRKKALTVPLSNTAVVAIREQIGKHTEFVFTYNGEPMRYINKRAWRKALKRAGIENFRWHDLRHTWASWHIQDGTPIPILQELGGWEDVAMVRKYAHLGDEHLAQYVNRRNKLRVVGVESPGNENDRSGHTGGIPTFAVVKKDA